MMTFRDFIAMQEMTSTGDIAGFSRITLPLQRRLWPSEVDVIQEKKKKKVKQPQVQELATTWTSYYTLPSEVEVIQDKKKVKQPQVEESVAQEYLVFSPSRFSYMSWTLDPRLRKLRPCHNKEAMSKQEAEALAKEVGDGQVVLQQQPSQPPQPEPDSNEYW